MALAQMSCAAAAAGLLFALTSTAWAQSQQTMGPTAQQHQPAPQDYSAALLGSWGDDGSCKGDITQFNADGTFHSFTTGGNGRWTLNGDRLTMSGTGVFELTLRWIDADHLDVIHADGGVGHSQRCPTP